VADRIIFDGPAGTRYTNTTQQVLYQFIASLVNTCGLCLQYHLKISRAWPIPMHYGCRCIQRAIKPGAEAPHEFTDYRELLRNMPHDQQVAAIGASNYAMLKSGLVKWEDIVTENRVRDFREVVANKRLTVKELTSHGVKPRQAQEAHAAVHTAEHERIEQHRRKLLQQITGAGVSQENLVKALSEQLASRVTVAAGPTGPYSSGSAWSGGPLPAPTGGGHAAALAGLISGWNPKAQNAAAVRRTQQQPAAPQPAQPQTPEFRSHEEAENWAKQRFPNAAVNMAGIPVESWQEIAREVDYVVQRWPGIADRLKEFGTMKGDVPPDMVASATVRSGRSLEFNPAAWQNLAKLSEQHSQDAKSGWSPKGTGFIGSRFYTTHELGHLIDGYLRETDPAKRHQLDLLVGNQPNPKHPHVEFDKAKAATISEYAQVSHAEAFAEAFASARWLQRPKNPIVQQFKKILGL
jgi:hypothetical protein